MARVAVTIPFATHACEPRPGKQVQLAENEIRCICLMAKEVFMSQPALLELEAPIKICGEPGRQCAAAAVWAFAMASHHVLRRSSACSGLSQPRLLQCMLGDVHIHSCTWVGVCAR